MIFADFFANFFAYMIFEVLYLHCINVIYYLGAKARVSANVGLSAGLQERSWTQGTLLQSLHSSPN